LIKSQQGFALQPKVAARRYLENTRANISSTPTVLRLTAILTDHSISRKFPVENQNKALFSFKQRE
jgi:hypothetical protein